MRVLAEHLRHHALVLNYQGNPSTRGRQPAAPNKRFESAHEGNRNRPKYAGRQERPPPGPRRSEPPPEIPIARIGTGQTSTFYSPRSWKSIGADDEVIEALAELGITRPSNVQAVAFQAFSTDAAHLVVADHAGSGKTLAYLVPLLQALKAEERVLGGPSTVPRCPRFVIVVPTAELCAQILRVCRALSSKLRFRSAAMTGGRPMRTQRETLESGVDVVIGTPGRLMELVRAGALSLERCSAVVCDEVDILLGGTFSFAEQVQPLREAAGPNTRFVLVTATLPSDVYVELEAFFPGLAAAMGPGLHRTPSGVKEQIIDCSGGDEVSEETGVQRKSAALFASLQEQRAERTIVFCNKIETCRKVENFLNRTMSKEDRVTVLPYHAAVAADTREANLQRFLLPPGEKPRGNRRDRRRPPPADEVENADAAARPERLILVCTDRASRGVDSAFVDHVVLFDFPRDPSEYVRRVGRTARGAGGEGLVTVLVLGRQVKLAKDVLGRTEKGMPVHAVPAAMPATSVARKGSNDLARFMTDVQRQQGEGESEREQ